MYDKLVAKVNSIHTSALVLKTKYNADKSEIENKTPNTSDLVKKADYSTKFTEIENKIPDVSSLATKAALTTVKNKIPDVTSHVKKTDHNAKITEIEKKLSGHNHNKYITTPEFNTSATFNTRLAQVNLVAKTNFDNIASSLSNKFAVNKTKNKSIENEFKKLKTFASIYFIGKTHF